jgi:hypothetical protein
MEIDLVVDTETFPITEEDAWWVIHRTREMCIDGDHRPLDAAAMMCLQLADVMAEGLDQVDEATVSIVLDRAQAAGITEHVLGPDVMQSRGMSELYAALMRFR